MKRQSNLKFSTTNPIQSKFSIHFQCFLSNQRSIRVTKQNPLNKEKAFSKRISFLLIIAKNKRDPVAIHVKKHRSTWGWEEKRNNTERALVMFEEPVPFLCRLFKASVFLFFLFCFWVSSELQLSSTPSLCLQRDARVKKNPLEPSSSMHHILSKHHHVCTILNL